MRARLLVVGAVFALTACGPAPAPPATTPPPFPSLDTPRAKIRAALLTHTPPGTTAAEVLHFIVTALPPKPGVPEPKLEARPASGSAATASGHPGVQRIIVDLGNYEPNPALLIQPIPLAIENRVTAQWAFDAEGRLLDIFVDKTTQIGE